MWHRFSVLVTVLLLVISVNLYADQNSIKFKHISVDNGLSQNFVTCIFQDSKGFMWFGTQDGLNRFDGYDFTIYYHDPQDLNSLSNNNIQSIFEDKNKNLWVGTQNGLNKLDRGTDRFTRIILKPENSLIKGHLIKCIQDDEKGQIFIGTNAGLYRFDPEKQVFTHFQHDPDDSKSLIDDAVEVLYKDKIGNLWIGTTRGLDRFDEDAELFTHFIYDKKNPQNMSVVDIYEDREGSLWIAINKAVGPVLVERLFQFKPEEDTVIPIEFQKSLQEGLKFRYFSEICEDYLGRLWIGSLSSGIYVVDRKNNQLIHSVYDPKDKNSLSGGQITCLFQDRSGGMWIGTNGRGVDTWNPAAQKFGLYRHDPNNPEGLRVTSIRAIYEDRDKFLWIGGYGGLDRLNRDSGQITHFKNDPNNTNSMSETNVRVIYEDPDYPQRILWLGGETRGMWRFDRLKKTFKRYDYSLDGSRGLGGNLVFSFLKDQSGYLWIGTIGGLNRFDPTNEEFVFFQHDPDDPKSLNSDHVNTIYLDKEGNFWIGTFGGGLNLFEKETNTFTHFTYDPQNPKTLSSDNVLSIYEDAEGILWIGTNGGGLNRFNRDLGTFERFTTAQGLPNNVIYRILGDEKGNLWLSTNNGLCRFDPQDKSTRNYDVSDGLQSLEFNLGAGYKSESGELFFGGINGVNAFYPGDIVDNPFEPQVVLTDFLLFNKSVPVGKDGDGLSILTKSILETEVIRLRYKENTISFEYAGLHYAAPEKNEYAYFLEGLEEEWNYVGKRRFSTYSNLSPGSYTFHAKASNNDGVWNEKGISVDIIITPPFWATLWFRTIVIVLIISFILLVFKVKTHKIKQRSREMEEINVELNKQISERLLAEEKIKEYSEDLEKKVEKRTEELNQAFKMSEESRDRIDAILKSVAEGLIVTDLRNRVILMNSVAENFLGIRFSDAVGRPIDSVVKEKILPEIVKNTLSKKTIGSQFDFELLNGDSKHPSIMQAVTSVIYDKERKKSGVVTIIHDVTHERDVDRMKTEFLSTAAHELRTPLTSIQGFSEILMTKEGLSEEEKEKFLYYINKQSKGLAKIIRDMLDLSRIEDRRGLVINKTKCDIKKIIKEVISSFEEQSQIHKFKANFPEKSVELHVDKEKIEQILKNLIGNSVKYSPKGGDIKINVEIDGDCCKFLVKDQGIGMTSEQVEKVFDKFFRADASDTAPAGTGLGMTIVKYLVEAHNGKIWVESKKGKGTEVAFTIPLKPNQAIDETKS